MDLTTAIRTDDTEKELDPSSTANGHLKKLRRGQQQPPAVAAGYGECMKNHAASLGGYAVDGCGEFMPSSSAATTDPTALKCAACGCHRNFHRREPYDPSHTAYFPDFRHHPPPPPPRRSSPSASASPSASPPPTPLKTRLYAPQMLLSLSTAMPEDHHHGTGAPVTPTAFKAHNVSGGRKRSRTKFSQEQKEKMYAFSEKLGWKLQQSDEAAVEEFCHQIGVTRGILKVWMHNNKNTFAKRELTNNNSSNNNNDIVNDNENKNINQSSSSS